MTAITVTVDVADFTPGGSPPAIGWAVFARAQINTTSGEIITTSLESVRLTDPAGTIQLDAATVYKVTLYGVPALPTAFYVSGTTDTTLAALYQSGQVDPTTLQPVTTVPTVADQVAALSVQVADFVANGVPAPAVIYPQTAAASTWGPIPHALARIPAVTVYDPNGDLIAPDVHATSTTVSLVFATPMAGTAVLT